MIWLSVCHGVLGLATRSVLCLGQVEDRERRPSALRFVAGKLRSLKSML